MQTLVFLLSITPMPGPLSLGLTSSHLWVILALRYPGTPLEMSRPSGGGAAREPRVEASGVCPQAPAFQGGWAGLRQSAQETHGAGEGADAVQRAHRHM